MSDDARELSAAADAAVDCLGVASTEAVLVVHNAPQRAIADSLVEAARHRAREATALFFPELSRHGEEPPGEVAEAMARADVVFAPTSHSLSHTQARISATARGVRVATMPTITGEIFRRALPIDYAELAARSGRLAARLSAATTARVTSAQGTDITLDLSGRTARSDDGDLRAAGAMGNLPAGEAFLAPVETVGDGMVVFDGSLAGHGVLAEPLAVTLAGGRAVGAEGEAGEWLLETLDAGGDGGRTLAELGIGTNPAATLVGNVLEDEKVIGTIHLAFGANASIGGATVASVHIDGIVVRPTVELEGERILDDGRLLEA